MSLEIIAEQRQSRVVVLDLLEHVVDQQRLVERGRHLGDENRIAGESGYGCVWFEK